ncbi:MAG: SPOR domain-containing protein, partial [Pseudomonadota bacterium]
IEFNWEEQAETETAAAVETDKAQEKPDSTNTAEPEADQGSTGSGLFVKAGVFGVKENADRLVEKIRSAGFPATGRRFASGSRTLTSVVSGPFATPEDQAKALDTIRSLGVPDAIASKG